MGFFNFFKRNISEQEFQEQQKMKYGLEKTRTGFFQNIVNTLTHAQIDDDLYDTLEEQLILADVGPMCAVRLVDELRDAVEEKHLKNGQQALDELRQIICQELTPRYPMELDGKPAVILVIGVNGVGKTTTIAKLARLYKEKGKRVMLAAGDTFRAAASEQLELWADRAGVPLVQAGQGIEYRGFAHVRIPREGDHRLLHVPSLLPRCISRHSMSPPPRACRVHKLFTGKRTARA